MIYIVGILVIGGLLVLFFELIKNDETQVLVLVLILAVIAAITGFLLWWAFNQPSNTVTPQESDAAYLTRTEFGEAWPLTVDRVQVFCTGNGGIIVADGEQRYALNGAAQSQAPAINPIWKENPEIPGTKINIAPLIERGQTLCRY